MTGSSFDPDRDPNLCPVGVVRMTDPDLVAQGEGQFTWIPCGLPVDHYGPHDWDVAPSTV